MKTNYLNEHEHKNFLLNFLSKKNIDTCSYIAVHFVPCLKSETK